MELHKAIKVVTDQFGKDIIAEKRFVYMIADYYSFRDNQPAKRVLTALVNDGYTARLLKLNDGLDITIIANQIIGDVCKNYGYKEELVVYVVTSIMRGLSFKYIHQSKPERQSSGKTIPEIAKTPQSALEKDISLYSGEYLMKILVDIFMLPLRSGRNGSVQKALIMQLLGDDRGKFVLNYFLEKGVVKWSPGLNAYYATYGNAIDFVRLHDKEHKKSIEQI